jgi:hypothetical protein
MRATCPTHLILLDMITLIIFGKRTSYELPLCAVFSSLPPLLPLMTNYSPQPLVLRQPHSYIPPLVSWSRQVVNTAWRVFRLRMEERAFQIWRVAVNILSKQSLTADKGWSSNLWVG